MRQNHSWEAAPPPAEPATSLGRPLAVVRAYDELIHALRARVEELNISRASLDEAMKTLPDGYAAKILAPSMIRGLGRISFGPMIQALGLAIVLVEDEAAMARISGHVGTRDEKEAHKAAMRGKATHIVFTHAQLRKNGFKGGKRRAQNMSKAARSEAARKAAVARWINPREARPSRRAAAQ